MSSLETCNLDLRGLALGTLCLALLLLGPRPAGAQAAPEARGLAEANGRLRAGLVVRGLGGVEPSVPWRGRLVRVDRAGERCTAVQREIAPDGAAPPPILLSQVEEMEVRTSLADSPVGGRRQGVQESWVRVSLRSFLVREPVGCRGGGPQGVGRVALAGSIFGPKNH